MTSPSLKQHTSKAPLRFWLSIIGIGIVVLWYLLVVMGSLVISRFVAQLEPNQPVDYYGISLILQTALPLIAAAVVVPCAHAALRRLGVKHLWPRAVALATIPATAAYILGLILELFPGISVPPTGWELSLTFVVSVGVAVAWGVWLLVWGVRRLGLAWATLSAGLLPVILFLLLVLTLYIEQVQSAHL